MVKSRNLKISADFDLKDLKEKIIETLHETDAVVDIIMKKYDLKNACQSKNC